MTAIRSFSLQSGSNGNSIYVEAGEARLLIDAGIPAEDAQRRMASRGRDIRAVDAVLVTHEHEDHVRALGDFQRLFGLPILATERTLGALREPIDGRADARSFRAGEVLEFGPVRVHSIETPHDAIEPVSFVVEFEGRRLGVLTDLGYPFPELVRLLPELDATYLESNYDPGLLARSAYPEPLRARIRGPRGHLSNGDAAELVRRGGRGRLRWVALAHLSETTNRFDLALDTQRRANGGFPVHHASRHEVSEEFEV